MNAHSKCIFILFIFFCGLNAYANDWLEVSYSSIKPDNDNLDISDGLTLAYKKDFDGLYIKSQITQGEVNSYLTYSAWDIWNAENVSFEDGHKFEDQITIESGVNFGSFYAALTFDAIYIIQWSKGYSPAGHRGYSKSHWEYGTGFLIGYQGSFENLSYAIDIGTTDHIIADYRLKGELEYRLKGFSIVAKIKDHADLDFTQHEIGVRFDF